MDRIYDERPIYRFHKPVFDYYSDRKSDVKKHLISSYMSNIRNEFMLLEVAFRMGDIKGCILRSYTIKRLSAYTGSTVIYFISAKIESLCKQSKNLIEVIKYLPDLNIEIEEAFKSLNSYVNHFNEE
jgi:hypothetical protein